MKFLIIADQAYHWGILDREIYLAFWIVIFTLMGFYLLVLLGPAGPIDFQMNVVRRKIDVPRQQMFATGCEMHWKSRALLQPARHSRQKAFGNMLDNRDRNRDLF